jgi:hypothetical protein
VPLDEGGQAVEETCMMIMTKARIEIRWAWVYTWRFQIVA